MLDIPFLLCSRHAVKGNAVFKHQASNLEDAANIRLGVTLDFAAISDTHISNTVIPHMVIQRPHIQGVAIDHPAFAVDDASGKRMIPTIDERKTERQIEFNVMVPFCTPWPAFLA